MVTRILRFRPFDMRVWPGEKEGIDVRVRGHQFGVLHGFLLEKVRPMQISIGPDTGKGKLELF